MLVGYPFRVHQYFLQVNYYLSRYLTHLYENYYSKRELHRVLLTLAQKKKGKGLGHDP